jgi:hypothetical protein
MAASSGVFAETIGGPTRDEGGGAADEDAADEGGGMFDGLLGKKTPTKKTPTKKTPTKKTPTKKTPTKKTPARKSKFTLEGAPITSGDDMAWALLGFILVALLILI